MKRVIALALVMLMLLSAQALAQGTLVTTGTGVVSVPADTAARRCAVLWAAPA